ncbi:MAG TPA: hypothetical protein VGE86_02985, partial [Thermoanaerobaculia bacterium]
MNEPRAPIADEIRRLLARAPLLDRLAGPDGPFRRIEITGASLEARALLLAALAQRTGERIALLVPSDAFLPDLEKALALFHPAPRRVVAYPNPSLSPYQEIDPSLAVVRDEIRALGALARGEVDLLILTARSLLRRLPRTEEFRSRIVEIRQGDELDLRRLLESLVEDGYVRTDLVGEPGELAFRGGILDVFPPNEDRPLRIELFGDTVDSIRHFETDTQRSLDAVERLLLHPMSQFRRTRPALHALAQLLSREFSDPLWKRDVAEKIERLQEHGSFPGMENLLPLAADSTSFPEILAEGWRIVAIDPDEVTTAVDRYETLLRSEYDSAAERGKIAFAPDRILLPPAEAHSFLGRARLALSDLHVADEYEELRVHAPAAASWVNRLGELSR